MAPNLRLLLNVIMNKQLTIRSSRVQNSEPEHFCTLKKKNLRKLQLYFKEIFAVIFC